MPLTGFMYDLSGGYQAPFTLLIVLLALPVPLRILRDNLADTGVVPSSGRLSWSPDINHFIEPLADPTATLGSDSAKDRDDLSQMVEIGQPNYIYIRLQNRGEIPAGAEVDIYYSLPSTLPSPGSWNKIGTIEVPSVAPGEFRIAGPLEWNNIPQAGHYCFIGILGNTLDPKPDFSSVDTIEDFHNLIRNNNNVVWKNFDVHDAVSGSLVNFNFLVQGFTNREYETDLELDLTELPMECQVELRLLKRLSETATKEHLRKKSSTKNYIRFDVMASHLAALRRMPLKKADSSEVSIKITLPETIEEGAYNVSFIQKIDNKEAGRITRRILVGQYPYIANRNSSEVHVANCEHVSRMSPINKVPYRDVKLAIKHGYNGCYYCLKEYDTDSQDRE